MKRVKRLQTFMIYATSKEFGLKFNHEGAVNELIYRLLKKYGWKGPYSGIFVNLVDRSYKWDELPWERKIVFDFREYYRKSEDHRNLILLNIFKEWMLYLSEREQVNKDPIEKVYQECIRLNFRNEWYLKDKLFRSPNHSMYAGVWCQLDNKSLVLSLHFYERDKITVIKKMKWGEIEAALMEVIYSVKPKWFSNSKFGFIDGSGDELCYDLNIDGQCL